MLIFKIDALYSLLKKTTALIKENLQEKKPKCLNTTAFYMVHAQSTYICPVPIEKIEPTRGVTLPCTAAIFFSAALFLATCAMHNEL